METIFVILALMFVGCNAKPTAKPKLKPLKEVKDSAPNKYIVVLQDTATPDDMTADANKISAMSGVAEVKYKYRHVIKGFGVILSNPEALDQIRNLPDVKYVEEDGIATISEASMTWGLDRLDQRKLPLDGNNVFNGDGKNVDVYVIDTGIYPENKFFGGRASAVFDSVGDGQKGIDCAGHGTHCAGTIGADYYGIARKANLYGVRVLNCYGSGTWSGVIAGMDWVAATAANSTNPAVASMSLGGGRSESINDAVQGMYDAGVPVSVAAGNSNDDACYYSPAAAPAAITVGATDYKDYRASFSNYGSCVDIFAPGVDVLSTVIGFDKTDTYSGTSMACPHVTGVIALLLGNNPKLRPAEVWEQLAKDSTQGVLQEKEPMSPDRMLFAGKTNKNQEKKNVNENNFKNM